MVDGTAQSQPSESFKKVWEAITYITNVSNKKKPLFHIYHESTDNNLHDQEDV